MTTFHINDAQDLFKRKIAVNTLALDNLKLNVLFTEKSIAMQTIAQDIAKQKIELVNETLTLFNQQLEKVDPLRNEQIVEIYRELNVLDETTPEYKQLCAEMDDIGDRMLKLCEQITEIEKEIPDFQTVTNYKITLPATTCAEDAAQSGPLPE
jgi:putative ubiquitin-RnfH superfamily antitoxin RatB of RatAB toxin-antitoxin module